MSLGTSCDVLRLGIDISSWYRLGDLFFYIYVLHSTSSRNPHGTARYATKKRRVCKLFFSLNPQVDDGWKRIGYNTGRKRDTILSRYWRNIDEKESSCPFIGWARFHHSISHCPPTRI